ncbi:MAG: oxygenase MpaB family protein [Saprospiraceae bacterium]
MIPENSLSETRGYFGPDAITWQLYREPLFVLGGVRALLLQIAHPAVADGVARYSGFQSDPFGRGYRTFAAMAMIYFGTKKQADETARRLWRIHSGIQGSYPTSSLKSPISYSANDPDLLLWVLATLTDTTLQAYSRMPFLDLPPDWKEKFYEESKIAARVLGIPDGVYPPDLQAFEKYFSEILNGDLLGSAPICREMAQAIVRHPRAPKKWAALFAAGWLPAPLCQRLGIEAGKNPEIRLEKWLRRFGRFYRFLPGWLRYNPAYHQAKYRIAKAEGKSPTWAGRFFNWLGKKVNIPLGLEVHRNDIPV